MTTPAEIIAEAIRDGFHELAQAVQGRDAAGKPQEAPGSDGSPAPVHVDPEPLEGAQDALDVMERAADVLAFMAGGDYDTTLWLQEAQALADRGLLATPQPLTVGQLGAHHIGKPLQVDTGEPFFRATIQAIEHTAQVTAIEHGYGTSRWPHDTPCTVED